VLGKAACAPLIKFDTEEFSDHLQRAQSGMGERLFRLYDYLLDNIGLMISMFSIAAAT